MRSKNKKEAAEGISSLALLSDEQLRVLASDIRADILSAVNVNGGHLSANLGAVELTMALLRAFDPDRDDILFDVGHQTYTYKILTGRSLERLRRFGGEPPFSDRFSSEYDRYCNGHAGTSISVGLGMDIAKRSRGDHSYTISVVGDASISSGLSMEALNLLSATKDSRLIVVVNDNGMSIGKDIGFMAKRFQRLRNSRLYFRTSNELGKLMSRHKLSWKIFLKMRNLKDRLKNLFIDETVFEAMGLKYIGPFDGHDFVHLDLAFKKAKSIASDSSVVVHIITKKGYGYPEASRDETGVYHGVAPYFADPLTTSSDQKDFTDLKQEELDGLMSRDEDVFVITPAMEKGSKLESIFEKYPSRTIDVGIAEENAVTLSSGLALKGLKPVVDIYSSFMQRSYDEIFEDISREKVPVLFLVERAGLAGGDGSSHHGLYDVAMVRTIPDCQVYMPFDVRSHHDLFDEVIFRDDSPVFIRYSKEPIIDDDEGEYHLYHVTYRRDGARRLVLAIGPRGRELIKRLFDTRDLDLIMLVNLLPDDEVLNSLSLGDYDEIYLYDSYGIYEGTASLIADYLFRTSYRGKFIPLTFRDEFITFGENDLILKSKSLDVESVMEKIIRDRDD